MEGDRSEELLAELLTQLNEGPVGRESLRVWDLSGVWRVHLSTGTAILKVAAEPFTDEARILDHVAGYGLPVPAVWARTQRHGLLGMLLEDLGSAYREPTVEDAAAAAVAVHHVPAPENVPTVNATTLAQLPDRARTHLSLLHREGRWAGTEDIQTDLQRLAAMATDRARDAALPPFGLVHSEFHPSSVHIGVDERAWRLLDFARALAGPGLLDLVSWFGTTTEPDPDAIWQLLHAYVAAGGTPEVLRQRAGLDAVSWGLGWHRLWVVEWFLEQAYRWMPDPAADDEAAEVLRRHLREARHALQA